MSYNYYPQSAAGLNYITYPAGPTPTGTTITSSASANTKGNYTQIAASTAFACNRVIIELESTIATTGRGYLVDIAVGGAGSEIVVVPNLYIVGGLGSGFNGARTVAFPLAIASGSRIAARCQDSTGSGTVRMAITLLAAGDTVGCSAFTAYGVDTSTSQATQIDPGATINTKGAYAELTSGTGAVAQYANFIIAQFDNTPTSNVWAVDLATGASGSETVLVPDIRTSIANSAQGNLSTQSCEFPVYLAAGTRIASRASSAINDATDRLLRVALYTAVAPVEPSGASSGGSSTWFGGA